MSKTINRNIPVKTKRKLRQEVGFGCPYEGCNDPFLEYHHFDPPWHEFKHHNPEGMIALCVKHHSLADAWTIEQTREIKEKAKQAESKDISERFQWMRDDILAIVGGNYYYEANPVVQYEDKRVIWFNRDDRNRLLLNLQMLTSSGEPRTGVTDNDWYVIGEPSDVETSPKGIYLKVRYDNGDGVSIRFKEWKSSDALVNKHPAVRSSSGHFKFPLVTAEINLTVGGGNISFTSEKSVIGGATLVGNVCIGGGLAINSSYSGI